MSPLFIAVALSVSQTAPWPEPTADFDYSPLTPQRGLIAVWANDRRGTAWEAPRGGDLWLGQLSVDGGTRPGPDYGFVLCHGLVGQTISSPRVAAGPGGTMVAWKVSWDGGEAFRASHLSWESGSPTLASCDAGVVAVGERGLGALQLEFSRGDFLATWEDAEAVRGRFVNGTTPTFTIAPKTFGGTFSPSLAAADVGFFVAWKDGDQFMGARVPAIAAGSPVTLTNQRRYFAQDALAGPPIVSGSPVGAAWPARQQPGGDLFLRSGAPTFLALSETPASPVVPMAQGPMATVSASTPGNLDSTITWVAHQAVDGGAVVTFFGNNSTLSVVPSMPLTRPGYLPQAMLMVGTQARLLTENDEVLSVTAVPELNANSDALPHYDRVIPSSNWEAPSATWVGPGWLLAWNKGGEVYARGINTASQESVFEVSRPDAGLVRVLPVADETKWLASFSGNGGSGVVHVETSTARLYARGNLPAAVSGRVQTLMWDPGSNISAYDSNATALATPGPAYTGVFGRCGAWAGGRLLVPIVYNGNELKIAILLDEVGANLDLHGSFATLDGLTSPCLVADGERILIAATNREGGLLLYETTVAQIEATEPATEVTLPTRTPGGLKVIDPVIAPTSTGWMVAWYALTDRGAIVVRMNYDPGAPPYSVGPATVGPDDREPHLFPSPEGHVLLMYRRFEPSTGNLVGISKVILQPVRDAGVAIEDAGVVSDGGVDAGLPAADAGADAGVDDVPMTFRTCGCDAGPTLLAVLGVMLLTRRRRSER